MPHQGELGEQILGELGRLIVLVILTVGGDRFFERASEGRPPTDCLGQIDCSAPYLEREYAAPTNTIQIPPTNHLKP